MVESFKTIEIRDNSIVQKKSSISGYEFLEIPKNKITSIESGSSCPISIAILSALLIFVSIALFVEEACDDIFIFFIFLIGLILLIIAFWKSHSRIVIKSPTQKIIEYGKGVKKFHKKISFN